MGNSFTVSSFFTLTGCILSALLIAWLLYSRSSALQPRLRLVLAAIRALTLSLIFWLLFSPLIRQLSYTLEKPIVIIAQDNSQSAGMNYPAGFNALRYEQDMRQLADVLSDKYDVRKYSFSDHIMEGLDFSYKGKRTDLSQLVGLVADKFINRNVGAFIIATDGILNKGGNPVAAVENLRFPVFTIAMGDTLAKKDLLIQNVSANELVYLDNQFTAEVQLQAYRSAGERTMLSVTEDGMKLYEREILLTESQFSKQVPVTLKASKVGLHQYTFRVTKISSEVSVQNNSKDLWVEVIDDRQKVLIAAGGPHPDLSALRQAISLNKHFDVSLVLRDQMNSINPKDYGLVILYQLPDSSAASKKLLEKVRLLKGPLWYIIGLQNEPSLFNQVQKNVSLERSYGTIQHLYSDVSPNLSVFDLDPASRTTISNFDPLQTPAGQIKLLGNIQAILNQRSGNAPSNQPQLFFMNVDSRKTAYLWGEGIWRWKLSEAKASGNSPVFDSLIGKVVQYLSVKDDKRKFIVYPSKPAFDENENVLFNASLYNESYTAVNSPDVTLAIINQQGKTYRFTFSKVESAYQLDAGLLPAGKYSYTASTAMGTQKYMAKGSFLVKAQLAEFQQTIANHQLLFQLAAQSGGKMVYPAHLASLKLELEKNGGLKTLSYEDRKYEELINFRWLFALLLIMLTMEWFLRKRNGEL